MKKIKLENLKLNQLNELLKEFEMTTSVSVKSAECNCSCECECKGNCDCSGTESSSSSESRASSPMSPSQSNKNSTNKTTGSDLFSNNSNKVGNFMHDGGALKTKNQNERNAATSID